MIWIGTYGGGLNRLKDGRFFPITTREGLNEDIVSRIIVDEKDNFWMLGNRGVSVISLPGDVALSEAVLSGRTLLFGYAVFLAVGYHLFVRFYEEPTLRRMFGEDYVQYCAVVSRWLPRRPTR